MKTNMAMQELLLHHGISEGESYPLDPKLESILSAGIHVLDGAYLFAKFETSVSAPRSRFGDLTGYECAVNHFHIESNLTSPDNKSPDTLLKNGITFVHRLESKLASTFPGVPFRIIFGYSSDPLLSCVVRFHKIRANEEWVMLDDLEGYKLEALMVLDVPSAA